jgi:lipopolysaccharide export system protein LptC
MNVQQANSQMQADRHEADRATVWQPRETSVADSVAQYSRFVSAMKVMLPQLRSDDERFRIGMGLVKGENSETLNMTNARYFGTDDKGQPYSVTAEGVRQHADNDGAIDLVTPKAEISLTNGTFLSAGASNGTYDRDNQKLDLAGEVTVLQDKGNQLRTTSASVMLKDGTASGREPVTGEGPFGKMEAAGGFDLSERGRIVHFHGPARLVLNPGKAKTSQPAEQTPDAAPPVPANKTAPKP